MGTFSSYQKFNLRFSWGIIYEKCNALPEGDWQGDIYFDPEAVEMCSIYCYDLFDKQEFWLSQWGHFISSQDDLLALGAHRV